MSENMIKTSPIATQLETELVLRDSQAGMEVARFNVGDLLPFKGIIFRIAAVAENEMKLVVHGYSGKRIKLMVKQHQKMNDKKSNKEPSHGRQEVAKAELGYGNSINNEQSDGNIVRSA